MFFFVIRIYLKHYSILILPATSNGMLINTNKKSVRLCAHVRLLSGIAKHLCRYGFDGTYLTPERYAIDMAYTSSESIRAPSTY